MSANWCEICQESCHHHPTICSVCGTALTVPQNNDGSVTTTVPTNDDSVTTNDTTTNERLLQDMRQASRDLNQILGNLRGQVQDLDNLTRNILQQQEDGNNLGLPPEAWDPQHSSGSSSRPTSKDTLSKIPRFLLNEKSNLFRQAKLHINEYLTPNDVISTAASVTSTVPAVFECDDNDSSRVITENFSATSKTIRSYDCIVGE
ncbi:MAG: hypothetical protein ACI8RD_002691 [Bacillariaceae sp.]|jgi:hypothetical protein